MSDTNTNQNTALAEEADTSAQTALASDEEAFLTELAGEDFADTENEASDHGQETDDEAPEDLDTEDSDDSDTQAAEEETDTEDDETGEEEEETDDSDDTEEEEETDTSDDDTGEDDDDEVDFSAIPPEHQKAVGKLIKQTREKERAKLATKLEEFETVRSEHAQLKSEREQLTSTLEQVKAQKSVPAPTDAAPYADITSAQDLHDTEQKLWELREKVVSDPESIEIDDGEGGKRSLTESEARRYLARIDQRLHRDIPAKRLWMQQHEQYDQILRQAMPDVDDANSELGKQVNRIIASFPQVKLIPGYRNTAAATVIGQEMMKRHGAKAWQVATTGKGAATPAATKANGKATAKAPVKQERKRAPAPPKANSPTPRAQGVKGSKLSDDEFFKGLADGR